MYKHICILLLVWCVQHSAAAQVVNTEKQRPANAEGLLAEAGFDFGLTRNGAGQTLRLGARLRLQYQQGRNRFLALGAHNFSQFDDLEDDGPPRQLANNTFAHIRYNRVLSPFLTWEVFGQMQLDDVQQITRRLLSGTGPRLRLLESDTAALFFGALYMYEHEQSVNVFRGAEPERVPASLFDNRLSIYLSGHFEAGEAFALTHVTYLQPNFENWSDFRVSSETSLSFRVTKYLSFRAYFQLVYDAKPPVPVANTVLNFKNGFTFSL